MAVSVATKRWTLEEVHSLPDDGNKYELIHGELFVTPAPSPPHQDIIARLARVLDRYVEAEGLGWVYQARSVIRRSGSETEPDLFVSQAIGPDWARTPTPVLVVEVLSRTTARRDLNQKRSYYLEDVGAPEYWIIDRYERSVRMVRPAHDDVIVTELLTWHPATASRPLQINVAALFG